MEEYTNRELGILLKNLVAKTEEGFKGIHDRQDKTNGNIIDNAERISRLENWRWYLIGGGSVALFLGIMFIKYI